MEKVVMLSVGFVGSSLGFAFFVYLRKMKNKLKKRILRGR
ncbi:MAG: hypothetical protein QT08_C0020G0024 [archaeon GW2011_AR17]|nr:MAG: hypothetical protein QT08_C0020G0024 [archaeon GW2011_AR17]